MKLIQTTIIALILALYASMPAYAAGFRLIEVPDGGEPAIQAGVWYPTHSPAPEKVNTEFGQALSIDAWLAGRQLPVVAISHGFGGWYGGHADTALALAEAGFVVFAPTHTGNTWSDMSSPIEKWVIDRPRHIRRVFNHLIQTPPFRDQINTAHYGIFGFSAGGLTAMNLIGGVPDFARAKQHCASHPGEFVCAEGMLDQLLASDLAQQPASIWGADPRTSAAAIAAPGLGFTFSPQSVAGISAPVQLWSGGRDDSVPTDSNAARIASLLPEAQTHWEPLATHFAFMIVQCRPAFEKADPQEYALVCGDAPGFDRYEFHRRMNRLIADFFLQKLAAE